MFPRRGTHGRVEVGQNIREGLEKAILLDLEGEILIEEKSEVLLKNNIEKFALAQSG